MTYTISIEPSRTPGKVTAHSSDGHALTTSAPLLNGARYWLERGAPSSASIVTIWFSAGATANLKLTFHLDHSAGADQKVL